MKPTAIFVEDDPQDAEFNRDVLREAGYEVLSYATADEVLSSLSTVTGVVELVVLDRNLPETWGTAPTNDVGDSLLERMLVELQDTHFVLLTAFGDTEHVKYSLETRGTLSLIPGEPEVDRVRHFDKKALTEFADHVAWLSRKLSEIDDVEIIPDDAGLSDLGQPAKRVLRKVGIKYGGTSVTANELSGGASGAGVWRVTVVANDGTECANLLVKESQDKSAPPAGVQTLLPSNLAAVNMATVTGFCGQYAGQVAQLADKRARPLIDTVQADEELAVDRLHIVTGALDALNYALRTLTLSEFCEPVVSWEKLRQRIEPFGIDLPSPALGINCHVAQQHGDLHPANILVANGQPVVIDFESQALASRTIDPAATLVGSLFNLASPARDFDWPSENQCANLGLPEFLEECPWPRWFGACQDWLAVRKRGDREYWASVLLLAGRQLKYKDVTGSDKLVARATALVRVAAARLASS